MKTQIVFGAAIILSMVYLCSSIKKTSDFEVNEITVNNNKTVLLSVDCNCEVESPNEICVSLNFTKDDKLVIYSKDSSGNSSLKSIPESDINVEAKGNNKFVIKDPKGKAFGIYSCNIYYKDRQVPGVLYKYYSKFKWDTNGYKHIEKGTKPIGDGNGGKGGTTTPGSQANGLKFISLYVLFISLCLQMILAF